MIGDTEQPIGNLYRDIPAALPEERIEAIIERHGVRIERILSRGHSSPAEGCYDQDQDEWVMLEQGRARLLFMDDETVLDMAPGDWVHIPAHTRHRVEWTDPEQATIWLAIHFPKA